MNRRLLESLGVWFPVHKKNHNFNKNVFCSSRPELQLKSLKTVGDLFLQIRSKPHKTAVE